MELAFGKARQLDDELDDEMPLAPDQVGEAAVEITRSIRFHTNRLTRVFEPPYKRIKRPWARDPPRRLSATWQHASAPQSARQRPSRPLISASRQSGRNLGHYPSSNISTKREALRR